MRRRRRGVKLAAAAVAKVLRGSRSAARAVILTVGNLAARRRTLGLKACRTRGKESESYSYRCTIDQRYQDWMLRTMVVYFALCSYTGVTACEGRTLALAGRC